MATNGSTSDPVAKTLVDQVHDRLLTVLSNRIWTGTESLGDAGLAQSLGVSRTPVRMALARLESEGLVRKVPGKGWAPTPLTLQDIQEIFDMKEALEALAARQAAEQMTPGGAEALADAVGEMRTAAREHDLASWIAADDLFHAIIYEAAGNQRLQHSMQWLDSQWYRFRMGYISQEGQLALLYEEHRLIAEAICEHDGPRAADCVLKHLQYVRRSILQITRDVLMPFLGASGAQAARDDVSRVRA
jgi:DNA-binding GntR family transcriptional regulator